MGLTTVQRYCAACVPYKPFSHDESFRSVLGNSSFLRSMQTNRLTEDKKKLQNYGHHRQGFEADSTKHSDSMMYR